MRLAEIPHELLPFKSRKMAVLIRANFSKYGANTLRVSSHVDLIYVINSDLKYVNMLLIISSAIHLQLPCDAELPHPLNQFVITL
jgi:hypothetical protein